MPEQADPLIGKTLSGRFEILAPLGVGGMGRVYRAIQHPLGRMVALKVLNPRYDGAKDPGFEKRFFLEASITAKLKHPNTITVHDYGRTDDGIYFIAMELVEGETLQHVLVKNGALPWPRAIFMGAQVARSIREAHKLGLVHRDLKPANIMLLSDGASGDVVKVLDFGLVKDITLGPSRPKEERSTEITQAGILLGSPLYMAPEQARNELDPRSDIYSLGVVLYQAIAGRTPFIGKESIDIIVKHVREKPPELKDLAEVPLEVNALVMKCLEKQPAARFQTMDELLEGMHQATSGQGISGIFSDPRSATGNVASSAAIARSVTPRATRVVEGPSAAASSQGVQVTFDTAPHAGDRRWAISLIVAGAGLIVGGLLVGGLLIARPSPAPSPQAAPTTTVTEVPAEHPTSLAPTSPPPAPSPSEPAPVELTVTSEPSGASVLRGKELLGRTPFSVALPREGADPLQLELTFSLEGYRSASRAVEGLGGPLRVHQALARTPTPSATRPRPAPSAPAKKPLPEPENGYKDDPYQ